MIRVQALKEMIKSGNRHYPIYLALMPADRIAEIADVPSYRETTTNADIALNVSNVPVKEWQRPRIHGKIEQIRELFNNTGDFMPNPVLIGENPNLCTAATTVEPHLVAGNETPVWELVIDKATSEPEKPLWILDGQHRIAGLAESAQSSNPVPVVFLLNQGSHYYSADTLAKIFAQVTTSATALGSLHREWLSYAFDLNHYSQGHDATEHKKSMDAIICLCKTPSFDGQPNPFHDRIQFIDESPPPKILPGGHGYSCVELKEIVRIHYYSAQKRQPELTPDELASEMCLARIALASVIKTPERRSVFFGTDSHHQKIMEDAFWSGVLESLAAHGIPPSWTDELRTLKFDSTDWDFSWKISLHGRDQSTSKKLAINVMKEIFSDRKLPSGSNNIADLLRGNGAEFKLEAFRLTSTGRRSANQCISLEVRRGDSRTFPIGERAGIRLLNRTLNIQEVVVTDKQAPPGTLVEYKKVLNRGGMILDKSQHKDPLELLFTLKHYGGLTSTADIRIDWSPQP